MSSRLIQIRLGDGSVAERWARQQVWSHSEEKLFELRDCTIGDEVSLDFVFDDGCATIIGPLEERD